MIKTYTLIMQDKMQQIKISVLIPVYNSEIFLEKCLDSILNQTYENLEIIIINDGSTDKSKSICDEYAKKDNRIKVIHNQNIGCSASRNLGINLATGEYIAFVDSDDFIEKEIYEKLLNKIEEEKSDVCICGYNHILKYNNIDKKLPKLKYNKKLECYTDDYIFGYPWNKLYKLKIIKENNIRFPIDTHMSEDLVFNVKYFYYINNISSVCEGLYNYYHRENSASNNKFKYKERLITLEHILKFIEEKKENKYLYSYKIKLISNIFGRSHYNILENLKENKDNYYLEFLNIVLESEKKYNKEFNLKIWIYILYKKIRLNFVFFKPLYRKIKKSFKILKGN